MQGLCTSKAILARPKTRRAGWGILLNMSVCASNIKKKWHFGIDEQRPGRQMVRTYL